MTDVDPSTPLGEAQALTRARSRHAGGTDCPLCGQHVEVYQRTITRQMAQALIALHQAGAGPARAKHWSTVLADAGIPRADEAKLGHWGLVAKSGKAGMWVVTQAGRGFLNGTQVPRHALIYNGRVLGFEGDQVTISDALGTPFTLESGLVPAALPGQG